MLHAAGLSAAASALLGQTAETVTMAAPAGCHWEYAREQLMTHQGHRWQLVWQVQLKSWLAAAKTAEMMTGDLRLRTSYVHLLQNWLWKGHANWAQMYLQHVTLTGSHIQALTGPLKAGGCPTQ